jgi:hypothetical protein
MARSPTAVALVAATCALLVIFQLLQRFGFPRFQYFHLIYDSSSRNLVSTQIPILLPNSEVGASDNGAQYLLGVGKADITGYGR